MSYAGNISPKDAWELLKGDPKAQLVDVRTAAEWNFVGVPDLSARRAGCDPGRVAGISGHGRNPQFERSVAEQLKAAGANARYADRISVPVRRAQPGGGDRHDGRRVLEVLQRGRRL